MIKIYAHSYKGKFVSGHLTGGAFDIRLLWNGRRIQMCVSKLTFQENAKSIQKIYMLISYAIES